MWTPTAGLRASECETGGRDGERGAGGQSAQLCLCKRRKRRGVAARMLLLRGGRVYRHRGRARSRERKLRLGRPSVLTMAGSFRRGTVASVGGGRPQHTRPGTVAARRR